MPWGSHALSRRFSEELRAKKGAEDSNPRPPSTIQCHFALEMRHQGIKKGIAGSPDYPREKGTKKGKRIPYTSEVLLP